MSKNDATRRRALLKAREDISERFKVSGNGTIRDPGPFEGQPLFIVYYYEEETADDEFEDEFARDVVFIEPDALDRETFPELQGIACLWIWEGDSGHVHSARYSTLAEEKSARDELEQRIDDEGGEDVEDDREDEPEGDDDPDADAPDDDDKDPPLGGNPDGVLSGEDPDDAAAIVAAAERVPKADRYSPRLVFVIDAWKEMKKSYPALTIEEFKERAAELHKDGHLKLARADLVEAMDPTKVKESLIEDRNATFHFLRVGAGK